MRNRIIATMMIFLMTLASFPKLSYGDDMEDNALSLSLNELTRDFQDELERDLQYEWSVGDNDSVCLSKEDGWTASMRFKNIPKKCAIICQYKIDKERTRLSLELSMLRNELIFTKNQTNIEKKLVEDRVEILKKELPLLTTSEAIGIGVAVGVVVTVLVFGLSVYGYSQINK